MYITIFLRFALRGCLTALVMTAVCTAGCDRATPEKLSNKLEEDNHEIDQSPKAVLPPDEGNANTELTNEQRLLGSGERPLSNPVSANGKPADIESSQAIKTIDTTALMNRSFISLKPVVTVATLGGF